MRASLGTSDKSVSATPTRQPGDLGLWARGALAGATTAN